MEMGDDVPEILPIEQWHEDYERLVKIPFVGRALAELSVISNCVKILKRHYAKND
jgi:hypothetical protein